MTPITIIISAFLLALIVACLTVFGGAVPVAISLAVLLIAVIGIGTYMSRRTAGSHASPRYEDAKRHAEDDDELPAGDPSTLYTSEPKARARCSSVGPSVAPILAPTRFWWLPRRL